LYVGREPCTQDCDASPPIVDWVGCRVRLPTAAVDGDWHLVSVTYENPTATAYLDAERIGDCSVGAIEAPAQATTLALAAKLGPGCFPFEGALDEVRILDRAASAADVGRDFAAGPLPFIPGTVGLWRFDAGDA